MNPALIQFFRTAVPGAPAAADPDRLREDALKRGYILHPDLLNTELEAFIQRLPAQLNSTFYKRWQDVVEKDRLQLFLDQIRHYASTYGTGFTQEGNGYVPNDGAEAPDFSEYTLIVPATEEELYRRCLALLQGGAALKSETVAPLCGFVTDYLAAHPQEPFDIDAVRNRVGMAPRPITLKNLLDERLMELYWEGWRRQDLIRFDRYHKAYDQRPQAPGEADRHTIVFPIQGRLFKMNDTYTQNPGY